MTTRKRATRDEKSRKEDTRKRYRNSLLHTAQMETFEEFRKAVRLKQIEVSENLSRPETYAGRVEHGRSVLSSLEFIPYCVAMEADPVEVLKRWMEIAKQKGVRIEKLARSKK